MAVLYRARGLLNKLRPELSSSISHWPGLSVRHASVAQPEPKPLSQCPGPKGLASIKSMYQTFQYAKSMQMYKYFAEIKKEYGPIIRGNFGIGNADFVVIFDPKDIEHLMRNENKHPQRMHVDPWTEYRKMNGMDLGLFLSVGEDWQRIRTIANPPLLRPTVVNLHTEDLSSVVDTMMERLGEMVRDEDMGNIREMLAKWAMESVCLYMFEQRIGSLEPNPPEDCVKLFKAIKAVQSTTMPLMMFPIRIVKALNLKLWQEHTAAWDTIYSVTSKYCHPVVERVTKAMEEKKDVHGFVATLLTSGISKPEIESNLSDFLIAGIDTSATAFSWALVLLSNSPDKQEILYKEISEVVPTNGPITQAHISQLRYLKAVFKEVLRMRPVVFANNRVLDTETILGGYRIPAGTIISIPVYALSHDEEQFRDPEAFRPERWIRGMKEDIHPFASLPFGHGARSCIGRRLAELELYILMCRVMQNYSLESTGPVEAQGTFVLEPKGPLNVKFHPRKA